MFHERSGTSLEGCGTRFAISRSIASMSYCQWALFVQALITSFSQLESSNFSIAFFSQGYPAKKFKMLIPVFSKPSKEIYSVLVLTQRGLVN